MPSRSAPISTPLPCSVQTPAAIAVALMLGTGCGDDPVVDGADIDPGPVVEIAVGASHACALFELGRVKCWGDGSRGQLGYGNTDDIGDDETPADVGFVDVGGDVAKIAASGDETCALLDGGSVRCWGANYSGLGYANDPGTCPLDDLCSFDPLCCLGDTPNETPAKNGDIDVGAVATDLYMGEQVRCVVTEDSRWRCWGDNDGWRLGYGTEVEEGDEIGNDEAPATLGDTLIEADVSDYAAGQQHSCVLTRSGEIRCWGLGSYGALGYGNRDDVPVPTDAQNVDVDGLVTSITAAADRTCITLSDGGALCWGKNYAMPLGLGEPVPDECAEAGDVCSGGMACCIGDDEVPAQAAVVDIGAEAKTIQCSRGVCCVRTEQDALRCWGGTLAGHADGMDLYGDDESPASLGDVDVGGPITQVGLGHGIACVLLDTGGVRCWGSAPLGYGKDERLGDDEAPGSGGDIPLH